MKTFLTLIIILIFSFNSYSQNILKTYPSAPYENKINDTIISAEIENPSIIPKVGCGSIEPTDYKIGRNKDFTVRVKTATDTNWTDLFEYNTFVNSSSGDLSGVTRSSFVQFDYSGTVNVEITCNNFNGFSIAGKVLIRPLSRVISQSINGNVLTLTLTAPTTINSSNSKSYSDKLSVEINGNRYSNLHIFANTILNYNVPNDSSVIIYDKSNNGTSINIYDKAILDGVSKKIIIKEGAIVIIPFSVSDLNHNNANIRLISNDEVYIEGGGVLKGGIIAENANNINIYGRGMIDLTNFPKQYASNNPNSYHYNQGITLRNCKNVTLDGLIINDSQQLCVEISDCGGLPTDPINNININNLKLFSRVVWGDGFHMKGTSNVTINDCFVRTSDDAIAVYASRAETSNRDALNIEITNSILYPDSAHGIVIGWHGNRNLNLGNNIYNLNFDNIDILEHDQKWIAQTGFIHTEYDGAIGIVCSDENKCDSFLFKNIRIEDFTSGSILSVRVMPAGFGDAATNGKYVQNIMFQDISYNGSGERKSIIQGVDCDRFVNGVHFQNFKINGKLITKLSDYVLPSSQVTSVPIIIPPLYNTKGFDTNSYAYNITFEEGNNYSTALADGYYSIQNFSSTSNLLQNVLSPAYVKSSISTLNNVWHVVQILNNIGQPTGVYRIYPYNDETTALTGKILNYPNTSSICPGRFLSDDDINLTNTNQQWKIVGNNTIGYKIINAYMRNYLTYSSSIDTNTNTFLLPRNDINSFQKWKINNISMGNKLGVITKTSKSTENQPVKNDIIIYPNPTNEYLNINNLKNYLGSTIEIIDTVGKVLIIESLNYENSKIYVGNINQGVYLLKITKENSVIHSTKFIKK